MQKYNAGYNIIDQPIITSNYFCYNNIIVATSILYYHESAAVKVSLLVLKFYVVEHHALQYMYECVCLLLHYSGRLHTWFIRPK